MEVFRLAHLLLQSGKQLLHQLFRFRWEQELWSLAAESLADEEDYLMAKFEAFL